MHHVSTINTASQCSHLRGNYGGNGQNEMLYQPRQHPIFSLAFNIPVVKINHASVP